MTIEIAVLGSCVSRDLFNSKFNPNYKDFYQCVLTQNQSSLISLMSEPAPYDPNPDDNLSAYQAWNVRSDLSKEFLQLIKEKQPSYLMLDFFADIHFGCIQLGPNQFITDNRWMVQKTSYYKALMQQMESGAQTQVRKLSIPSNEREYLELWKRSVDKLFAFLAEEVPNCRVILHQARNVEEFIDESGERRQLGESGKALKIDSKYLNELWETMDNYVLQNHPAYSINVFHKDLMSFEAHPWGPFYVHYTMDYYRDCMNELHRIVLDDRLSVQRDDVYLSIVSDLGESDKRKTQLIWDKEKAIEALQAFHDKRGDANSAKSTAISDLKTVPRRVKHLVRNKVIRPLRKVYQQR